MRTLALYEMLFGLITLGIGMFLLFATDSTAVDIALYIVCGIILVGTGLRLQKGWRPGLVTGAIISLGLAIYYGMEWLMKDQPFFSDGLIAVMGIISLLFIALIAVQPKQRERIY